MGSMTLACVLVLLAWRTRWRWPVLAAMVPFVVLVGLSRVYLGVHYPSDILAGWAAAIGVDGGGVPDGVPASICGRGIGMPIPSRGAISCSDRACDLKEGIASEAHSPGLAPAVGAAEAARRDSCASRWAM